MRLDLGNNRRLIVLENVVNQLLFFRQIGQHTRECGGLLIGYHPFDDRFLVVSQITQPCSGDRRFRKKFVRSSYHNRVLHDAWATSGETETFVGLWHTHSEAIPVPSEADWTDWENTLLHGTYFDNCLIYAIVGTGEIGLWMGDRDIQFTKLKSTEA